MSVMIGIDPHKALHAVCAIDRHETELAEVVVRSGPRQLDQLLGWAAGYEQRTWAIESASGLGYLLAQQLLAHGELVVDVPATLSSRARLLGSGRSNKNDANDARAVAVAALRAPSLTVVRVEDHVSVLRLLAKAQFDIAHARSRACSRLHALVSELVAGGIGKEVVVNQGEALLATIRPTNAVQRQRLELAHELLDEIRVLDERRKTSRRRITEAVTASGTSLTEIYGGGPDHRRDRDRLHRRHLPLPELGPLRHIQRHRTDRVLIIRTHRAPTLAARQPHAQSCDPHDRRHPDPQRRQ